MHQIIRANESLLREFVDKYFYRALSAFIESQREFDRYLRRALGLTDAMQNPHNSLLNQGLPFLSPNWATIMMEPFARALLSSGPDAPIVEQGPSRGDDESDVRKSIDELKQELEALRTELKKR